VGVFALVATAQGLWIGSDTERIGRYEHHARITGMFVSNGRFYYTLNGGDPRLYYRWFTPESGTLGADAFVASGAGDGRNWSGVNGMTMASGHLLYATTTGALSTVDFPAGLPTGPSTVMSGPPADGRSWQSRALFVLNPPN
jgi:hypothetical protein